MLFSNFSFGFSVYVGQNFGAKNAERIKLGVRQIFLLVGGLSFFAGVLTLIFAEPLVSLYVKPNETEVIAYSLEFIRIQAWFFPFLGWIWLYNSTVKGMGKINISMVSSVVELCSKIGLSLLLPIWIGTTGIWFAAPIGTFWASSRCSSTITAAAGKSCSPSPPQNPQRRKIQQNGKSPKHLNRVSDFLFYLKISPQHHVQKHH